MRHEIGVTFGEDVDGPGLVEDDVAARVVVGERVGGSGDQLVRREARLSANRATTRCSSLYWVSVTRKVEWTRTEAPVAASVAASTLVACHAALGDVDMRAPVRGERDLLPRRLADLQ